MEFLCCPESHSVLLVDQDNAENIKKQKVALENIVPEVGSKPGGGGELEYKKGGGARHLA